MIFDTLIILNIWTPQLLTKLVLKSGEQFLKGMALDSKVQNHKKEISFSVNVPGPPQLGSAS